MRDAMLAGLTLNIFNNHSKRVQGANLAQIVNVLQSVILTDKEKMLLTPTYHVMRMYNVHQDATLLGSEILNPTSYTMGNENLQNLSVSASKDSTGIVTVSMVNIHYSNAASVQVDLRGANFQKCTAEILTSGKIDDHNNFEQPNKITPKEFKNFTLKDNNLSLTIPPYSVIVVRLSK
jgi:alpha-L-arabinofuranosidase